MFSIVIPTHQRTDLLRECLVSVVRSAPPGTEIVVVDDASPGEAATRVAQWFAQVKVVRRKRRGGFAAAANAGIRASRGAIVQLLNDDTVVTTDWWLAPLHWFQNPAVGAVAPLVLAWPDGQRIDSAGDRYYVGGIAVKRGHRQPVGPAFARPCSVFGASASSAFYRRAALNRVGLFPESFGSYFEDVDLAFRLQRAGFRTVFEPRSRILHHVGASHCALNRRLIEQQSRNEERVYWRNLPARALWRALPKHVAVLAAKAWLRWHEGTLMPWACGKLRLLAEVQEIRKHRQEINNLGDALDPAAWQVDTTYRSQLQ
jgi:GT2 family glycosyltransferase